VIWHAFTAVTLLLTANFLLSAEVHAPLSERTVREVPPIRQEILDFQMIDLYHGVQLQRISDGTFALLATEDGGEVWTRVSAGAEEEIRRQYSQWAALESAEGMPIPGEARTVAGQPGSSVRKLQFATAKIGWALFAGEGREDPRIWFTFDGGRTWQPEMTEDFRRTMQEEQRRQEAAVREASYYRNPLAAADAMGRPVTLIPPRTAPGDVVLVRTADPGKIEWDGRTFELQPFGAGYYTYLPIRMGIKPGIYLIRGATLVVEDKSFETQYLVVTEEQESMRRNTERIQADQRKIDKARSESHPAFLFPPDSPFMKPVEGRLTTPYGYTRYVNGAHAGSHTAIDLAAPEGTPIYATNDGIVALAEELYLTGLSVYIDHGMHLFSQYAHLSELKVKAGDKVKKGDIIGLVGSTGFSTGPHLHFTFWAHNTPVNPNLFFDHTPFDWHEFAPGD
jgi:hypothetical protein